MNPTLNLQEEELARNLKAQGKNTREIMGAIARSRTSKIVQPREEIPKQVSVGGRVIRDIPSDLFETGRNIVGSIQRSSERLADVHTNPEVNFVQKLAATGPQLAGSVLDVVGESVIGGAKLLTTDEFEKTIANKLGRAGQRIVETDAAKNLTNFYNSLDRDAQFLLSQIIAPTAEVLGEVATLGVGTAAVQPIKRATRQLGKAVEDGIETVIPTTNIPETPIIAPIPPEVKDSIVRAYDVAIKPNLSSRQTPTQRAKYDAQISQSVSSIVNNIEDIRLVDESSGELVSRLPENLKDYVDSLDQTKQLIFKKYDELAREAGETGARVDTARVANELDTIINSKSLAVSNPAAVSYAREVKERLVRTGSLSAVDTQDVISNYNAALDAFYKNPSPEGLTKNTVDALVANNLRRALDEEIDALTGGPYQALKNEYGALSSVERDVMRAFNRDARRNAKGLIDFTDVFSGGQVVSGILSMNPAAIGHGLAQKAISEIIKMVNDPNRKIKQIFQEASRFREKPNEMIFPTRKQLPPAGADTLRSSIGSGAPIRVTPKGQGVLEGDIAEFTRDGGIKRSDSDPQAQPIKNILEAEEEALHSIRGSIEMSEMLITQTVDGGYIRSSSFPNWLPDKKQLRTKDMMKKVFNHLENGTVPDIEKAPNQHELYEAMKSQYEAIKFDKLARQQNLDISSNDIPFALLFTTGTGLAAYYTMDEDGSIIPLAAAGMMVKPVRSAVVKNLDEFIEIQRKIANNSEYAVIVRQRAAKAANSAVEQREKIKALLDKAKD